MPSCFLCKAICPDLASMRVHFKLIHYLHAESEFHCGEMNCYRTFSGIKSYRRHWQLNHSATVEQYQEGNSMQPTIANQSLNMFSDNITTCSNQADTNLTDTDANRSFGIGKDHNNFDLTDFSTSLRQAALRMIAKLYKCPTLPRNQVQNIIEIIELFLGESWLGPLHDRIENKFIECGGSVENTDDIKHMIDELGNAFRGLRTEYQRFKEFEAKGVLIPPIDIAIGQRFERVQARADKHIHMSPVTVNVKFFSLRKIFKKFFEMPDVYDKVAKYKQDLESETYVISNFIQGSLWKNKIVGYENKQVFPLFVFFDDYETGNPLGSHTGANKLGGVYVSIPCFPPEFRSALSCIFIALLFYSNDRREFRNERVFNKLIEELNFLQTEGIELELARGKIVIYFKLGLILGDNLGLHSILGFVENFRVNFACRFCKMSKEDRARCGVENKAILRTPQSYHDDLQLNNYSLTGIKEECIFNRVKGFHVTDNRAVDIMHDWFEGVCEFDMVAIILHYIERVRLFTLTDLNTRITCFDYGPVEKGNTPPEISLDHLKRFHIAMSASEMLTLVRYFGLMVGDFIPEDDPVWNFYLILQEIISLITAKSIQIECCDSLKTLIEEHNRLYQDLFKKPLKPKAHLLIHYPDIMRSCGPLIHLWCMRFGSKHRQSKLTASVTSSRRDISTSLAIKHQLILAPQFVLNEGFTERLETGPRDSAELADLNLLINGETLVSLDTTIQLIKWVKKQGTKYKRGMVVSVGDDDGISPFFGVIEYILIDKDDNVYFIFKELEVHTYEAHFCAYKVSLTDSRRIIKFENLLNSMPLSLINEHRSHYVITRDQL